jgi:hypothetical protein
VSLTFLEVDGDMDGVKDDDYHFPTVTEEITPGGFIAVNDDDDNGNGKPDNEESGTVSGEDDLVGMQLSVAPDCPRYGGQVELSVGGVPGAASVKIWSSSEKGTQIIPNGDEYKYSWPADDDSLPDTVYIEGLNSTTQDLVHVGLQYIDRYGDPVPPVHIIDFTVVKVEVNASLGEEDELSPGLYVAANWDDDDEDGWEPDDTPPSGVYTGDKDDPNIYDAQKAPNGDDDFRSFLVSISPHADLVEQFPNSKMRITFGSSVKIWETKTKKTVLDESSELSSGHEYVIENLPKQLYLEGVSGSSTFKDVELKATWLPKSFSDSVNVTVFEVDLTGRFGYGSQAWDNDKKHSENIWKLSSDKNGRISWDDANADGAKGDMDPNCEYFHNCMECQGTVKPSGVTNEVQFDIKRDKWRKYWDKFEGDEWQLSGDATPWQTDDSSNSDEDLTPSVLNHIYSIDGPGYPGKSRIYDYRAYIGDFREWVMVEIDGTAYQCSDYYKWHSQMYLKWKNDTEMTRDSLGLQKLSAGWITVPDSP